MDNFYYNLLNIGNKKLNKEEYFKLISKVINEEVEPFIETSPDLSRLCIIISRNINSKLKELRVDSKIVNTTDLYDMYEHQFILSSYEDNGVIKHVLIDPTFIQFRHKNNDYEHLLPIDILLNNGGTILASNLIKKGYSEINDIDLKRYIASIKLEENIDNIDFNIDDIIFERKIK